MAPTQSRQGALLDEDSRGSHLNEHHMRSHDSVGERTALALDIPLISISYLLIALVALAPRLVSLGSFVTVDEQAFWMPRSDTFLRAIQSGDFPATAISTHPGVTTMW